MKVFSAEEYPQGGPEWFELRRGRPTASNFDRIITPVKGELSAQADSYIDELIGDLLGDVLPEGAENYTNRAMRWGQQIEAEARHWYATFATGLPVTQVGFLMTDDQRFGCSPDGMVGESGVLELKCPQNTQHVTYCRNPQKLVNAYRCQVHGEMLVSGRDWCDLVSYARGLPALRVRVERDAFTEKLSKALDEFYGRYMEALQKIRDMGT